MEDFEILQKKISKLIKNYVSLKEEVDRLRAENKFLNKEITNLREKNSDLLDFESKQNKVVDRIKKVLKKLDSLKGV